MRTMVHVLRQGDAPELAPSRTLADIEQLASTALLTGTGAAGPRVDVRIAGDPESVPPTVAAAVFRLAQESVTNARRHARGASIIVVLEHTRVECG